LIISRSILLSMRNVADKSCTENQNTRFIFDNLFSKACRLLDNVGKKYCRAGQATDDNLALAHCTLDTCGYKHTQKICYSYCFNTETIVTEGHLYVMLIRTLPVPFVQITLCSTSSLAISNIYRA